MTTLKQIKVAMIRDDSYPMGVSAPVYLHCPCGANPATDLETKKNVHCQCGKTYNYNGWVEGG